MGFRGREHSDGNVEQCHAHLLQEERGPGDLPCGAQLRIGAEDKLMGAGLKE